MKYKFIKIAFITISLILATRKHPWPCPSKAKLRKLSDNVSSSTSSKSKNDLPKLHIKNEVSSFISYYFLKRELNNEGYIIFALLTRVMAEVLNSYDNAISILNNILYLQKQQKQSLIFDLILSIHDTSKAQRDHEVKQTLDITQQEFLLMPPSKAKEMLYKLNHFLVISNALSSMEDNLDFSSLKSLVLDKFPYFKTANTNILLKQREQCYLRMRNSVSNSGLNNNDIIAMLPFFNELECLSTYMRIYLQKVPIDFLLNFFNEKKIFIGLTNLYSESVTLFTVSLELIFYLININFIPYLSINHNKTYSCSITHIKGVVQFIGVLYFIQKHKMVNIHRFSFTEILFNYLEKAKFIADLPKNEKTILKNYNLLLKKSTSLEDKETYAKCITTQYIYSCISLFRDVEL